MNGDGFCVCVEWVFSGLVLTNGRVSSAWSARLPSWMPLKLCFVEQSDIQLCCLLEDE